MRVDVFVAKTGFERAVIAGVRRAIVLGIEVCLASPEAAIIYKLLANRRRDQDDVDSIFEARQIAGDELDWKFLDSWAEAWGIEERLEPLRRKYGAKARSR